MIRIGSSLAFLVTLSFALSACNGGGDQSQLSNNPGQRQTGMTANRPSSNNPAEPSGSNGSLNNSGNNSGNSSGTPDGDGTGGEIDQPLPVGGAHQPSPPVIPVQTNDPNEIPSANVVWALSGDGTLVQAIQRQKGQILYTLHLLHRSQQVIKAGSALWIVALDGTLSRFDFNTGDVDELFKIAGQVGPIAVSEDHAWVAHKFSDSHHTHDRPEVLELSAKNGELQARIPVADPSDTIGSIELMGDSLYVLVDGNFALYRIKTASLETNWVNLDLPDGYGTGTLTSDGDRLWILDTFSSKLVSLLGATQAINTSGDAPQSVKSSLAVNDANVFVMAGREPKVLKLNADGSVAREIAMPEIPQSIARVSGQIWVSLVNRIVVLDPRTGATIKNFGHLAVQSFARSF